MNTIRIELFTKQCSIDYLWDFIEENLYIDGFPSPMYWITKRAIKDIKENRNIFLAMIDGCMVGCIVVKGSSIEILCVKKKYRKQGIGTELIKYLETLWKCDKRRKSIRVSTLDKFNAKMFYESLGFTVTKQKGYDHTWYMKKELL